jgi:hypothetical protein
VSVTGGGVAVTASVSVTSVWSHEVEYGLSRELPSVTVNTSVPPALTVTGAVGLRVPLPLPVAPGTAVPELSSLQLVPLHRSPEVPGSVTEPEMVTVWAALNGDLHVSATDFPLAGTICNIEDEPPAGTAIQVVGDVELSLQPASDGLPKPAENWNVAGYDHDGAPYLCSGLAPAPVAVKSPG